MQQYRLGNTDRKKSHPPALVPECGAWVEDHLKRAPRQRRSHPRQPCIPSLLVELRRRLRNAEMAAAYPRAHQPVGDDVRRLSNCLYPCHVRPTEEVRVSSPRLLQVETQPLRPSASEYSPRPSTFGAAADKNPRSSPTTSGCTAAPPAPNRMLAIAQNLGVRVALPCRRVALRFRAFSMQ